MFGFFFFFLTGEITEYLENGFNGVCGAGGEGERESCNLQITQ